MQLTITDTLAILGALAWLPTIFTAIKSHFTKAEIRIISQKIAEIGFTTYGPIFNMRLAFTVKHRDIVISNLKIKIKHEHGEIKIFEWQGIRQHVMKMHTGETSIPYEKENSVLAIKLNQKDVEERIIQCQEVLYIVGKKKAEDIAITKLNFLKEQDSFEPIGFLKLQECTDLYNYIKQSFSWKAGKYEVIYEIESPEKYKLIDNKYSFSLLPIDIDLLEKNKNSIEQDYINAFVANDHASYKEVRWNWRNPYIHKINRSL